MREYNCRCPVCKKRFQSELKVEEITPSILSFEMNNGFIYWRCDEHKCKHKDSDGTTTLSYVSDIKGNYERCQLCGTVERSVS